jgi:hypothetical protein
MYSDAGKSPHDIERQPDGSIKVVPTKTLNPPSYVYERLFSSHGGVVDTQLNHVPIGTLKRSGQLQHDHQRHRRETVQVVPVDRPGELCLHAD